ncbi:MAG: hypothetical protein ABI036_05940 [Fibrobacteria bacterium]
MIRILQTRRQRKRIGPRGSLSQGVSFYLSGMLSVSAPAGFPAQSRICAAASRVGLALLGLALLACDGRRPVRESPLPDSQFGMPLERFEPPEALEHIGEWYPHDWRLLLFRALTDSSRTGRISALLGADSIHPGEPLIAYELSVAYLESDSAPEARLARPWLDKALAADPYNGVLQVMDAYLLLQENRLGRARALFLDPRRLPRGDFYYPRLEEALLGLLSHSRALNPYTLTEAVELYRRMPFPPFEKWIDILYSVFLSPLQEHPYDIRERGREAARGLFRLGRQLRVQAYSGPKILSNGYEQQSLGFMFQLKSAEFLTLFYRTFEDTGGATGAFQDVVDAQREYEAFMASEPWKDASVVGYLDRWSELIKAQPGMTVAEAVGRARAWPLWRKTLALRYPERDDG